MKTRQLPAAWVAIAMAIGITLGYAIFASLPDKRAAVLIAAGYVSFMSDMYDVSLHLIKLLIGPLVFAALVVGIAHRGSDKPVWYVFTGALAWFSVVSLVLGLIMANILGDGLAQALRCDNAPVHGAQCE